MASRAGYIYVLVNAAMPGLVKVGKTTRDPAGRAQELSGATGVAAPFIVIFDQIFADCDAAELTIHHSLERGGLRPAPNREFFRASPSQVIKLIMAAHAAIGEAGPIIEELDSIGIEYGKASSSWQYLLRQAHRYHYGLDDNLEDHDEAYRLYHDAARLGSVEAMGILGWMNFNGEGVGQNDRAAFQWWKEGSARGDYYCYASMAKAFIFRGKVENAAKCWIAFFRHRSAAVGSGPWQVHNHERWVDALVSYLMAVIDNGIPGTFLDEVRLHKNDILPVLAEQRTSKRASDLRKAACWRASWWFESDHNGTVLAPPPDSKQQAQSKDRRVQAVVDHIIESDGHNIAPDILDDIRLHRDDILLILAELRIKEGASNVCKAAAWRATWFIEDTLKD